jgi:hypothetical protein
MNCISNHFNLAQTPPLPSEMTYNKLMDQTALPVYTTLAELLEAELALAAEAAEKASN